MADNDEIVQNIKIEVEDGNFEASFDTLKSAAKEAFESIKDAFNGGDIDFDKVREAGSKAFDELKEAGSKAFEAVKSSGSDVAAHLKTVYESIKSAGSTAFEALKGAGSGAASELKTAFAGLGVSLNTVFIGVGVAITAVVVALGLATRAAFNFVESHSKIINALSDLSAKTHTSIQDISALETAFAHAGVSATEFASGYSHLSDVVEKTWDKIKKDTQTGVDTLEQKSISAAKAAAALSKIESERKQTPLNNPDLGRPIDPFKGDLVTAEDTQKAITKELELRQARLASKQAEREENEARRNDITQVTKGVQELIDGNQTALKSFNASAENIVKGVVAAAGKGAETLDQMGESFASIGSKAPDVKDVLTKLGEAIKNIDDPALRSKVAVEALGKSVGQSFIGAFDSGKLPEFIANVEKMGGTVDKAAAKVAGEFKSALTGLNADLSNIGSSISTAFGPGFTAAIKEFDDFLVRNQSRINAFATTIGSVLGGAIKIATTGFTTFADTIGGIGDALGRLGKLLEDFKKNAGFKVLKEDAKDLFQTVKAVDDLSAQNEDQRKQGKEKLFELNKKDAEAEKKRADEEGRTQQNQKGKKKTPEELVSGPIDFSSPSDVTTKAASGINSILKQSVEGWGQIIEGWGIIFDKLKSTQDKAPGQGTDPFLKETNRTGLEPTTPGESQSSTPIDAIKNSLQPLIDTINSLATKKNEPLTGPATGLGIRGDADDSAAQATTKMASAAEAASPSLDGVKTSSDGVSPSLDSVKTSADGLSPALDALKTALASINPSNDNSESEAVAVADGGHIRGPGTSTSDSIPAMLSDGEYVVRKSAVDKIGVAALDAINAGRVHFSEGGAATIAALKKRLEELNGVEIKPKDLTPKDASGDVVGDAVNTAKQVDKNNSDKSGKSGSGDGGSEGGGDPDHYDVEVGGRYNQALLDSINAASEAAGEADPNFIPILYHKKKGHAEGGLIGDVARALNNIKLPRFAEGGIVSMAPHLPRFADGGTVSIAPRLPRFADGGAVSSDAGGGAAMPHLGSVDLTTNYGNVRVMADRSGLTQLRKAAVQRNIGTSPKSSWVK